jgi:wobble nucleotide-excising tRNase
VQRIEEHNTDLRAKAAAIPAAARREFTPDEFCALPALQNIEDQIVGARQRIAAIREQDAVRDTPTFETLTIPSFDLERITAALGRSLADLEGTAVALAQAHFAELGSGGEAWVADGMARISDTERRNEACPFCGQDLAHSSIIGHYRAYFSQEYARLKGDTAQLLADLNSEHPREIPARFEHALRVAAERRAFWSALCDVPRIEVDADRLLRAWQDSRDVIAASLMQKLATPLEQIELPPNVLAAIEEFHGLRGDLAALNDGLQEANQRISIVKGRASTENVEPQQATLARLVATRARHAPEIAPLCEEYLAERAAKEQTERLRDTTQSNLEEYRTREFPLYEDSINAYLSRFSAGFRIEQVTPVDTRGGPTCNYTVVINATPIPIAGASPQGEPAFRNTLSSGDRSTLALAFFLSALDRDPACSEKVLVVDDPICSLDEHRSLTTVQELRQVGERVSQLIILSHDRSFLSRMWMGLPHMHCSPIKIVPEDGGSNLASWDIEAESKEQHDRNHALLRSYLQDEADTNNREVATALRPVLERFLRVAYPDHFPPRPGAMRSFRAKCQDNLGGETEILSPSDVQELDALLEYSNQFHHTHNESGAQAAVNDGALRGFVTRVLRFTTRRPIRST